MAQTEEEQQCRELFETVSDVIYVLAREGTVTALNTAFETITGWSREEWLGKPFAPLLHPDDVPRALDMFARGMRGEPPGTFELRIRTKDGGYRIGEFISRPQVREGVITGSLGIARDITERKRTEDELRLLQTMTLAISEAADFRSALETALRNVCEATDWSYGEAWVPGLDGRKLVAGPVWHGDAAGLKRFGQASRTLTFELGTGLPGRVWKSQRAEWLPDVAASDAPLFYRAALAREAGLHAALGVPIVAGDGVLAVLVYYLREARPEDVRMVEVVSVVAAQLGLIVHRKRVEDALRESERRFSAAFNGSSAAMAISALGDGHIIDVNEAAARMLGCRREEALGRTGVDIGWWSSAGEREAMIKRLRRQRSIRNVETEYKNPAGRVINGLTSFELIDLGGAPALLSVVTDVTERKKAEEERARLSRAVEQTADSVLITDSDGVIEYANPAFERTTGYSLQEVVGKKPSVLKSGEHPQPFYDELWRTIRSGQPFSAVFTNRKKDGELYFEEKTITPLKDVFGNITHYVSTGKDITARVQAEEALRESEERLRTVIASAPIVLWAVDREGAVTFSEGKALETLGIKSGEMVGRNVFDLYSGQADILEAHRRALAGESFTVDFEGAGRFLETQYAPLLGPGGEITGAIGVSVDVTERHVAQEGLRHYAERLAILREIDQAILAATSPEAVARGALRRVQRLIPFRRASLMTIDMLSGEAVLAAVHADTRTRVHPGLRFPLEEIFEVNPYLREGKTHVVEDIDTVGRIHPLQKVLKREGLRSYIAVPLMVEGELVGSLNLWSDKAAAFTAEHIEVAREVADEMAVAIRQGRLVQQIERHAAGLEQRVAERTAELQEANEELEAFAHSVAHDLRTPLFGIRALAHVLHEEYCPLAGETATGHVESIVRAAASMDEMIGDLLSYSRLARGAVTVERVSLRQAVDAAIRQLGPQIAGRSAEVVIDGALPAVRGHRATLVQVALNLVANAVKFVPPDVTPRVRIRAEKRGREVRLWVEDNGIGIDPEHQEAVFRIFERLHDVEEYPGTGIGLAIVRKGVERMDGSAGVESEPGKGSRFWVQLPKA